MSRRSHVTARRVGLLLLVAVAVTATLAVSSPLDPTTERTLVVTSDGEELLSVPVSDDTEVVIEYTHSVEKTLVRDVYVTHDDGLRMVRMEFSSFGAGLPSEADVVERGGRYVYHPPTTDYETLRVKTGFVADHDLLVDGQRHDIAAMSDGGPVEITIQHRRGIFE